MAVIHHLKLIFGNSEPPISLPADLKPLFKFRIESIEYTPVVSKISSFEDSANLA